MAMEVVGKPGKGACCPRNRERSVSRSESARMSTAESVYELLHRERAVKTILRKFRKN